MEYGYAEAICLRSPVSGMPFPKSVSPKQTLNKKPPLFVQGIRLRRSHVPQKPCEQDAISETGILEQNTGILCSMNSLTCQICVSAGFYWIKCFPFRPIVTRENLDTQNAQNRCAEKNAEKPTSKNSDRYLYIKHLPHLLQSG